MCAPHVACVIVVLMRLASAAHDMTNSLSPEKARTDCASLVALAASCAQTLAARARLLGRALFEIE